VSVFVHPGKISLGGPVTVYAKSYYLDIQAPRSKRLAAYDLLATHVVLQSVQGFREVICRPQLHNTPICG